VAFAMRGFWNSRIALRITLASSAPGIIAASASRRRRMARACS
jgi:hypothetical protein